MSPVLLRGVSALGTCGSAPTPDHFVLPTWNLDPLSSWPGRWGIDSDCSHLLWGSPTLCYFAGCPATGPSSIRDVYVHVRPVSPGITTRHPVTWIPLVSSMVSTNTRYTISIIQIAAETPIIDERSTRFLNNFDRSPSKNQRIKEASALKIIKASSNATAPNELIETFPFRF